MSKHTPGTWQAINWTYHSTSTVVVDDPSVVTGKRVIAECATEEDARLIAAAPDLLEALQTLLEEGEFTDYPNTKQWQAVQAARAAIAKVKGGAA